MAALTTLGLGRTMEKKLHTVGIHSAEELVELGILPEDARRYLMEERHKSEDEAELLIRRYWN